MATKQEFRNWGKQGGKKRAQNLTEKRRKQIASKAAIVRWLNEKAEEKQLLEAIKPKQKSSRTGTTG